MKAPARALAMLLRTLLALAVLAAPGACGGAPEGAGSEGPASEGWMQQREAMVRAQLQARGIRDERVLDAMREVPRHRFVPEEVRERAYEDGALPIGAGQTISQPYVVAAMTEALRPEPADRVLEVGTGSGYQAAVLGRLVDEVFTIEIVPSLAERARRTLAEVGAGNVHVITGDGYRGLPGEAPFDGILVTAAPEEVPPPLLEQLAVGGRMVIPVGDWLQELRVIERTAEGFETETLFPVRFVPFTREEE